MDQLGNSIMDNFSCVVALRHTTALSHPVSQKCCQFLLGSVRVSRIETGSYAMYAKLSNLTPFNTGTCPEGLVMT